MAAVALADTKARRSCSKYAAAARKYALSELSLPRASRRSSRWGMIHGNTVRDIIENAGGKGVKVRANLQVEMAANRKTSLVLGHPAWRDG